MPITPEVLKWARTRSGYACEDLKKELPGIADWENGIGKPTYPQLEKLADKLKIPVVVFFFPSPPEVPPIRNSFRTIGSEEYSRIPPRIRLLLRKARAFQMGLEELYEGRSFAEQQIVRVLSLANADAVDTVVAQARELMGVSVEAQLQWSKADDAFKNWRAALFKVGVYVFKDAFRQDGFSGFSLFHEEFPIIYVNNSTAVTRQIFTLFHELAHLLLRTSGIYKGTQGDDLDLSYRQEEQLVNRFASRFLLPELAFWKHLENRPPNASTAAELANRFKVSREVVYRRFLDRQLISSSEYESQVPVFSKSRTGTGGNYYASQITYLGLEYIKQAFAQFYQTRINSFELADYLNVKPSRLEKLEEMVLRRDLRT